MKWMISSLYLLIFLSLLGFGWAIDRIYETYQDDVTDPLVSHKIVFASVLKQFNNKVLPLGEDSYHIPELFRIDSLGELPLPDVLKQKLEGGELIVLESDQGISLHQRTTQQTYVLGFGPIPETRSRTNILEYSLTIIFYLGIALVLIIWITPLIKSVHSLSNAAKQVGEGKLSTRLNSNALYLADLYRNFNSMVEKLNTLSDTNRLFNQAVSHDLRTPLTRIKFALEDLSKYENSNQATIVETIHQDIEQIESLTNELLEYARLEQTRALQSDAVDLHVFLQQLIGEFSHCNTEILLDINPDTDWNIHTDSRLIHKIVRNLTQNALTYANEKIAISVSRKNSEIEINVEDDGPGIEPSLLNEIFKPFNQANRISEQHFGLGLAICQRAISLLEGSISADNHSKFEGARFIVRLPI